MSHKGNVQLTVIFTATSPELVEEGEAIFRSHAKWMEESHYREGDKALLRYNFSRGSEQENPLDPNSKPTGNTCFVLMEVYETPAGITDHWQQAAKGWDDFNRMVEWAGQCNPKTVHGSEVLHSLW